MTWTFQERSHPIPNLLVCFESFRTALPSERVIGGVAGWESLDAHVNETIVWVCLAFSILSADLVLQWQQLGPSPSLVRRHSPASPERMLEAPLGNPAAFACSPEGSSEKSR
jgi:hypothetical protein